MPSRSKSRARGERVASRAGRATEAGLRCCGSAPNAPPVPGCARWHLGNAGADKRVRTREKILGDPADSPVEACLTVHLVRGHVPTIPGGGLDGQIPGVVGGFAPHSGGDIPVACLGIPRHGLSQVQMVGDAPACHGHIHFCRIDLSGTCHHTGHIYRRALGGVHCRGVPLRTQIKKRKLSSSARVNAELNPIRLMSTYDRHDRRSCITPSRVPTPLIATTKVDEPLVLRSALVPPSIMP